jgi:Rrf2 family protein
MLTRTSEYALRALIYLAQHEDSWPIPGREVAEHAEVPPKYLSKILGDLVRVGVLESSPGKTGGFRLSRSATKTTLYEVLRPFEQFDRRRCPFGNDACSDENPCLAHSKWKLVVETEQRFLHHTSIYEVAIQQSGRGNGRKRKPKSKPKSKS